MIKSSVGKPGHAEKLFGAADGKGAKSVNLHAPRPMGLGAAPPAGKTSITGGDPLSQSMGNYGKGATALPGLSSPDTNLDPTAHAGSSNDMIRGGSGGMRSRPRQGGLQDGPATMPSTPMDD